MAMSPEPAKAPVVGTSFAITCGNSYKGQDAEDCSRQDRNTKHPQEVAEETDEEVEGDENCGLR